MLKLLHLKTWQRRMNWADYLILSVVVVSILIGVFRGFTRELLGILGWVLAFWAAGHFAQTVADTWLSFRIQTPSVRRAAAFGGVFLIVLLLASILTYFLGTLVRDSALAGVDRTLGGGFGFLRGVFLVAVLVLVAGSTSARKDPWWSQSLIVPHVEWLAESLKTIVPERWLHALSAPESPPSSSPAKPR